MGISPLRLLPLSALFFACNGGAASGTTQASTIDPASGAESSPAPRPPEAPPTVVAPPDTPDAGCVDPSAVVTPMQGAVLSPEFAGRYAAFDLGSIPGVPGARGQSLGAVYVNADEPSALYVVGSSENEKAALYRIAIKRDACRHIVGYDGVAQRIASMPFADANIVLSPLGWIYPMTPMAHLGHLPIGGAPAASDLTKLGVPGPFTEKVGNPGSTATGLAVVPAAFATAGELVASTYPNGDFFHITTTLAGGTITATAVSKRTTVPNGPGGIAYVPEGSPGFAAASMVVTEWFIGTWDPSLDDAPDGAPQGVAAYEVDAAGDPKPETRRPFFTQFPRPWGAFFEPITGDFLFATWRGTSAQADRIVAVRGFAVPPRPPAPK
ncbi:MAG: hypothetical protein U0235_15760 [Polyangiaceae bacterium]